MSKTVDVAKDSQFTLVLNVILTHEYSIQFTPSTVALTPSPVYLPSNKLSAKTVLHLAPSIFPIIAEECSPTL